MVYGSGKFDQSAGVVNSLRYTQPLRGIHHISDLHRFLWAPHKSFGGKTHPQMYLPDSSVLNACWYLLNRQLQRLGEVQNVPTKL